MKLQKFISILDQRCSVAGMFFKMNGQKVFIDDTLLTMLINEYWGQKKWYRLITLGWIIDMELRREYNKEKTYFDNILPTYRYFADYMKGGCAFFSSKLIIPFEEWEDLAKEQVDILKILVKKNQLKSYRRTNLFREFDIKCGKRVDLFEKKGYLHDYDFDVPSGL